MGDEGLEPRRWALRLMTAVTEGRRPLSQAAEAPESLAAGDRARAERLAREALRWAGRSDRLLGPYLRDRPSDLVLNAMRLALYEINVEAVPPHAAVNAAVSLVPRQVKGLTNAVLRNVGRSGADWDALPLPRMPKWLRRPLLKAHGKDAVLAMEKVHSQSPPLDLTVKSDATGWAERLGAEILPTGSLRLSQPGRISGLPGFAEGAWWVQDAAAALPARLLAAQPGERVLDLCAAPGGKTMQLAAAGADVTALDISSRRLLRLRENLARTGLSARVVEADVLAWRCPEAFDAILLDAPCTATGTLRRHPDLAFAKDGSEVETLVPLQAAMLDRALGWLKPGGRLVYCTCSLLAEEGEAQLAAALSRHPDIEVADSTLPGVEAGWCAPGGGLRTRPDHWAGRGGMDGFFIALLRKPA